MTRRGFHKSDFYLPPAVVEALLLWFHPFAIAQQPATVSCMK